MNLKCDMCELLYYSVQQYQQLKVIWIKKFRKNATDNQIPYMVECINALCEAQGFRSQDSGVIIRGLDEGTISSPNNLFCSCFSISD